MQSRLMTLKEEGKKFCQNKFFTLLRKPGMKACAVDDATLPLVVTMAWCITENEKKNVN